MKYSLLMGLIASCLITACSSQVDEKQQTTTDTLAFNELTATQNKEVSRAILLGDQQLIVSEQQGIELFDATSRLSKQVEGNFEHLASKQIRLNNAPTLLIASLEQQQNQLVLFSWQQATLTELTRLNIKHSLMSDLCLFRSPQQGHLYAFVITSDGQIEQRLIFDAIKQQFTNQLVRNIPSVEDTVSCAVDDQQSILYVAEESVGIWQYSAQPEAMLQRRAIAMTSPFGQLGETVTGLATQDDGMLIASTSTPNQLHIFNQNGAREKTITLAETVAPENLNWFDQSLTFFNDETASIYQTKLSQITSSTTIKPQYLPSIPAQVETQPTQRFGDAADDPEVWVNQINPEQSLILGTDKRSGLYTYQLNGKTQQFIATGHLNNVDIRYNFNFQGKRYDIASASNRTLNSIAIYLIDQTTGELTEAANIPTSLPEVYGLCMYHDKEKQAFYTFINDKNGQYQQYRIYSDEAEIRGEKVRTFSLDSQPEGCVSNDNNGDLFVGEEGFGIWHMNAKAEASTQRQLVAKIGKALVADVEGMSLYHSETQTLLVVSSQGNDSYQIYNTTAPYQHRLGFQIGIHPALGIDGASETDGLAVTSANLGGVFSQGLLVVQDGRNLMPYQPQNFKVVSFTPILQLLENK